MESEGDRLFGAFAARLLCAQQGHSVRSKVGAGTAKSEGAHLGQNHKSASPPPHWHDSIVVF